MMDEAKEMVWHCRKLWSPSIISINDGPKVCRDKDVVISVIIGVTANSSPALF